MTFTDDSIGACGASLGGGFCSCPDYRRDESAIGPPLELGGDGVPREDTCTCGHHRVMHATTAPDSLA